MEFIDGNRIKVDPPKRPKKLTGTRFANIMGLNTWSTPFAAWCEITRTYEKPFEDTIYTIAGKVIEPKVIDYLNRVYFLNLKSPTDVYGENYFQKTWGDFFKEDKMLGGMWDAIGDDLVVEIKTTKRAEDWQYDIPIYYKLQACLYAYLLKVDNVIVTASFLEEKDYQHPENYEPCSANTIVREFKLSEEIQDFKERYVDRAVKFWEDHILTGISPEYDERKDAEILKALRTNKPDVTDVEELFKEAEKLEIEITNHEAKIADKRERLKEVKESIKNYMVTQFREADKTVEVKSGSYSWNLTRTTRKSVDVKRLKDDNVYDKYVIESEVMTLKNSLIEKGE
ncbi:MAG: YqaJ viral recombinase family protein [Clostridia bacterium]|nr:YqaJ viral recombinase family protein [Clostridia bacterium]